MCIRDRGVAGLGVQHRAAPVQHPQDDAADLVVLFAEDLHLDLGVAQHRHLLQDNGVQQHQQDAVEDLDVYKRQPISANRW